MSITRRTFIGSTLAAGALAALETNAIAQTASGSKSEVYVGKGSASEIIPKLFEKMGGISQFVKPGSRVMIKPNMGFANPADWATTTSPEAVYVAAKLCLEAGAKRVIVCDNSLREPELCKEKTGIGPIVKGLKGVVVFIPKQDSMFVAKSDPRAKTLTNTDVVKEVFQSDFILSLPIAKSHSAAGVSLNIKGLMGLVKDRGTFHRDMDLHKAVAEQLYYIKPHLYLIDASRALIDNGPAGPGKVSELKTYVAGLDPVAVDSYGVTLASWYGKTFDGKQVKHLKEAAALGFGNVESAMIREIAV
jgi:uncharacterized protein (DUF362 family)